MSKMLDRLPCIPDGSDKEEVDYFGYIFTRDGRVFKDGKEVSKGYPVVNIIHDDFRGTVPKASFIKRVFFNGKPLILPDASSSESAQIGDFTLFRDGTSLCLGKNRKRRKSLRTVINGKVHTLANDRAVYSVFSGTKLLHYERIIHIDGDKDNDAFSNLRVEKQKNRADVITEEQKTEMRNHYLSGSSYKKTADAFGVSTGTVFNAVHGVL